MDLKKNDFVEIEFIAKTSEGEVFDTNIKEELSKLNSQMEAKPFVFCLGQNMFLKAIDEKILEAKKQEFDIELKPEQAFGNRKPELIQKVPSKVFKDNRLNPVPGAVLNFDGKIGKILAVSGGRAMVDFNNPMAGKEVIYHIKILRKVEDQKEQIKSFNEFLFKKNFEFKVEGKKLIMQVEKPFVKFVEMFKEKFKEIFELEMEIKEIEMPKKDKISQ